jgi:hypothetical protein
LEEVKVLEVIEEETAEDSEAETVVHEEDLEVETAEVVQALVVVEIVHKDSKQPVTNVTRRAKFLSVQTVKSQYIVTTALTQYATWLFQIAHQ